jgi:hypothetical protein
MPDREQLDDETGNGNAKPRRWQSAATLRSTRSKSSGRHRWDSVIRHRFADDRFTGRGRTKAGFDYNLFVFRRRNRMFFAGSTTILACIFGGQAL